MDVGTLFFSFSGRINRAKYWLAVVIYIVISIILTLLALAAGQGIVMQAITAIVDIVVFISSLAVGAKRLHDRNRTAWWLLVFYVVPGILITLGVVIAIVGAAGGSGTIGILGIVLNVIAFALFVWAFIELGCLRGTIGANQYGPDPLPAGA